MTDQLQKIDELRALAVEDAVQLFEGNRHAADAWLGQPLIAIGGETPSEYMDSPEKIRTVRDIIARLEHGILT
jgi:putative toxin-antitoxin system antitoxin component (TIGR02293 family)